jgi:hypothetical protein
MIKFSLPWRILKMAKMANTKEEGKIKGRMANVNELNKNRDMIIGILRW